MIKKHNPNKENLEKSVKNFLFFFICLCFSSFCKVAKKDFLKNIEDQEMQIFKVIQAVELSLFITGLICLAASIYFFYKSQKTKPSNSKFINKKNKSENNNKVDDLILETNKIKRYK